MFKVNLEFQEIEKILSGGGNAVEVDKKTSKPCLGSYAECALYWDCPIQHAISILNVGTEGPLINFTNGKEENKDFFFVITLQTLRVSDSNLIYDVGV